MLTDVLQLYPDGVLLFQEGDDNELVVCLEVQREIKKDKLFSWGCYPGHVFREYRCPPRLVILCSRQDITDWARQALSELPAGLGLAAKVVGPDSFALLLKAPPSMRDPALLLMGAALRAEAESPNSESYPYVEALRALGKDADFAANPLKARQRKALGGVSAEPWGSKSPRADAKDAKRSFARRGVAETCSRQSPPAATSPRSGAGRAVL